MSPSHRPENLAQALTLRAENPLTPYAGGTDLMPGHRRWMGLKPDLDGLLFIGHLPELKGITVDRGTMRIGACTTLAALLKDSRTPAILREIISCMAAPGVRNLATLGGNICNASPAGDTLPYLFAADARAVLQSAEGQREVPMAEFILGPGRTCLKENEILTGIGFYSEEWDRADYQKVAARKANALSKISFLGLAKKQEGRVCDLRLAWGAVGPLVVRSRSLEQNLIDSAAENGPWTETGLASCLEAYAELINPIDDQRSSAAYRKQVALGLAEDFLMTLV